MVYHMVQTSTLWVSTCACHMLQQITSLGQMEHKKVVYSCASSELLQLWTWHVDRTSLLDPARQPGRLRKPGRQGLHWEGCLLSLPCLELALELPKWPRVALHAVADDAAGILSRI